jgi:hypothetical protein
MKLKLSMGLIPKSSFFKSLFNYYLITKKTSEWRKIKKRLFELEGKRCWICGPKNRPFDAHEFWEFNHKKHVQKLKGIHHLCSNCHMIKHYKLWTEFVPQMLSRQGLTEEHLIAHFMKINKCSRKNFEAHKKRAFKDFETRSQIQWSFDVSALSKLGNDIAIPADYQQVLEHPSAKKIKYKHKYKYDIFNKKFVEDLGRFI